MNIPIPKSSPPSFFKSQYSPIFFMLTALVACICILAVLWKNIRQRENSGTGMPTLSTIPVDLNRDSPAPKPPQPFVRDDSILYPVTDRTPARDDKEAYFYLLHWVRTTSADNLRRLADKRYAWRNLLEGLMSNPKTCRGKVFHVRGEVAEIYIAALPENPSGRTAVLEGHLRGNNREYTFVITDPTRPLKAGDKIEFYGVFFKIHQYETQTGAVFLAPILIGNAFAPFDEGDGNIPFLGPLILLIVVILIVLFFLLNLSDRRKAKRLEQDRLRLQRNAFEHKPHEPPAREPPQPPASS
ncbi:MAG: hypothetical protein V1809_16065 [Planctomycetota bacterium]